MNQFLLAAALIAAPVAAFTAFTTFTAPSIAQTALAAPAASLGDLSGLRLIITDVQAIAATGDFTAAETRITDFETGWDDAAGTMRPLNTTAWGNVDIAADAALDALRASAPASDAVNGSLGALLAALDNPDALPGGEVAATVTPTMVSGISVTDANGRALPCEDMLTSLATALAQTQVPAATKTAATDLQTKALERCNADDDARADGFSAQALALLAN